MREAQPPPNMYIRTHPTQTPCRPAAKTRHLPTKQRRSSVQKHALRQHILLETSRRALIRTPRPQRTNGTATSKRALHMSVAPSTRPPLVPFTALFEHTSQSTQECVGRRAYRGACARVGRYMRTHACVCRVCVCALASVLHGACASLPEAEQPRWRGSAGDVRLTDTTPPSSCASSAPMMPATACLLCGCARAPRACWRFTHGQTPRTQAPVPPAARAGRHQHAARPRDELHRLAGLEARRLDQRERVLRCRALVPGAPAPVV